MRVWSVPSRGSKPAKSTQSPQNAGVPQCLEAAWSQHTTPASKTQEGPHGPYRSPAAPRLTSLPRIRAATAPWPRERGRGAAGHAPRSSSPVVNVLTCSCSTRAGSTRLGPEEYYSVPFSSQIRLKLLKRNNFFFLIIKSSGKPSNEKMRDEQTFSFPTSRDWPGGVFVCAALPHGHHRLLHHAHTLLWLVPSLQCHKSAQGTRLAAPAWQCHPRRLQPSLGL